MHKVRVININNVKHLESVVNGGYQVINVCRPTPLGNPYPVTKEAEREEAIKLYEKWLWKAIQKESPQLAELKRIIKAWRESGRVALGCHCAPRACHAEVVAKACRWLINSEEVKMDEVNDLLQRIDRFDWTYMMSDDGRVERKWDKEKSDIIKAIKLLNTAAFLALRRLVKVPTWPAGQGDFAGWVRRELILE